MPRGRGTLLLVVIGSVGVACAPVPSPSASDAPPAAISLPGSFALTVANRGIVGRCAAMAQTGMSSPTPRMGSTSAPPGRQMPRGSRTGTRPALGEGRVTPTPFGSWRPTAAARGTWLLAASRPGRQGRGLDRVPGRRRRRPGAHQPRWQRPDAPGRPEYGVPGLVAGRVADPLLPERGRLRRRERQLGDLGHGSGRLAAAPAHRQPCPRLPGRLVRGWIAGSSSSPSETAPAPAT